MLKSINLQLKTQRYALQYIQKIDLIAIKENKIKIYGKIYQLTWVLHICRKQLDILNVNTTATDIVKQSQKRERLHKFHTVPSMKKL